MGPQEKRDLLKAMLTQIASDANRDIQELPRVVPPPREEGSPTAFEGLESVRGTADHVESGLEKLANDRIHEITDSEVFALEAIVMPQNRPVVFVRTTASGPSYDDVAAPWLGLNTPEVKDRISRLLPSIGRIELPLSSLVPYGGTGFVVGDGLLMTNRHVAQLFSQGIGSKIKYQAGGSAIDFKRQIDTPEGDHSDYLKVLDVVMIHPYWDMALLSVGGLPSDHALPLSVTSPEELSGRNIVAIGYPAKDFRSDLQLQDHIFGGKYNVKRLQPGTVRSRARVRSFENVVSAMTHDASTLGGNSGSAIIDVTSGEVVALHFAGEYLKANYAVPMFELARDSRVAPKLNFRGAVRPTIDWDSAWRSVENDEVPAGPRLAQVISQPSPLAPPLQSVPATPHGSREGYTANWTIPLYISISVGETTQPATFSAGAPQPSEAAAESEAVVVNQDYSTRPGYDPEFLEDFSVALPRLSKDMEQDTALVRPDSRKDGNRFELPYYHYSVYMNRRRRTAWFSAANVNGDNRPNIGKRQGDRWYVDPRIMKYEQIGQEAFESGIDRGHLTRREDTAWGVDVESATLANNDTFHFTNCSLQASAFNRGKDRWQGLEQILLEQHAKKSKRRMVLITGPLFGPNDPVYKNDRMNYAVRCPLQFWKICVLIREDGTPSAIGFILGQEEIKDLPGFEETFDVAATQIKIADLEEQTGLNFGDLRNHDHFAKGGPPGSLESVPGTTSATKGGRIIRGMSDIVV